MSKQTVSAMVEGGKASAGPPLGPALGPTGVKIPDVIAKINEKTAALKGMQVPVDVIVDTDTKTFEIEVGTPPTSAMIKKELGIEKGSKEPGKLRAGDLTMDQVKNVAQAKFGSTETPIINQIAGTARSMGITVGQGAVTEDEVKAYEDAKAAEEAAAAEAKPAVAEGEKPAAEGGEKPAEGEAPAEGEKPKEEGKPEKEAK
jgi:large subunit ribosomal protein L11